MKILFTNSMLDPRAGSELYLLDLARRLKARGHSLSAFSTRLGEVARALEAEGVEVVDRLDRLSARSAPPDLIHGQHHLETMMALLHFPGVPALYVCHGAVPWEEMPPLHPRIRRHVAVDEPTRERLRAALANDPGGNGEGRIVQILNFVDLDRFRPRPPLPARPRRALALSNRASEGSFLPVLREACLRHGVSLDAAGLDSGRPTDSPESLLPGYDLVFAKARSALEALAVGCAVILCDASGLGPLVTPGEYDRLRPLNFGFRCLDRPHDPEQVAREIARYEPGAAMAVSARVRAEAGIEPAAGRYLRLYEEIVAEARAAGPVDPGAERAAAVAYLRRVRETYPVPSGGGPQAEALRRELAELRGTLAFRWRQKLLDRPRLQRLFSWLRRP